MGAGEEPMATVARTARGWELRVCFAEAARCKLECKLALTDAAGTGDQQRMCAAFDCSMRQLPRFPLPGVIRRAHWRISTAASWDSTSARVRLPSMMRIRCGC